MHSFIYTRGSYKYFFVNKSCLIGQFKALSQFYCSQFAGLCTFSQDGNYKNDLPSYLGHTYNSLDLFLLCASCGYYAWL